MILEAITFKLSTDLLLFFKKNRIYSTNIKFSKWNRSSYENLTFSNSEEAISYFNTTYKFIDDCQLGSLVFIESIELSSDLYYNVFDHKVWDLTGDLKIESTSSYDRERTKQSKHFLDRQRTFIQNAIAEYSAFHSELKRIYIKGIYSPCFAAPGWSENTLYIEKLKSNFLG